MLPRFPVTRDTLVGEISTRKFALISPEEPATSVRRLMRELRSRVAVVVDRRNRLLGIITRGDILTISSRKSNARAKDLMREPTVVLSYNDKVVDAVKAMLRADEWYAPVVKNDIVDSLFGLEHAIQRMLDEGEDELEKIPVADIMTREVETVSPDDHVMSVWEKMRELRYAGLPVVDEKGRLIGIVTQHDLLAKGVVIARETTGGPSRGAKIRDLMTSAVEYVTVSDSAAAPAKLMVYRGYGRIPVVESRKTRKLVGIVDREDIVRLLL